MARRKDHDSETLKSLILQSANTIIGSKGSAALTARNLAKTIGYTPGTIYNFYRDMDALVVEVNYHTLGALEQTCRDKTQKLPSDFSKIRALAYAYVDFAHEHIHAWNTLFGEHRKHAKLPRHYQNRLSDLFQFIEDILRDCLKLSASDARNAARVVWAALHGITLLTLDGRLKLVGVESPHEMIDNLLGGYFSKYAASHSIIAT